MAEAGNSSTNKSFALYVYLYTPLHFSGNLCCYMLLHNVTCCYMLGHAVTHCYMLLYAVTRDYMLLHAITLDGTLEHAVACCPLLH